MSRTKFGFSHLTADERVELAEELWDSLAEIQEALPLAGPQEEELDRRLADYREDKDPGTPWAEALSRIKESGA
ncbi:MAG TPA: addiction module protein [Thermoanaerobaculia bacterium]|nr:addiction module protein [Thermoanaerobaculia bacterium]